MSDSPEDAEKTCERMSALAHPAMLGEQLRPAILSVLVLTFLTGCVFPLLLFAIGRPLFPRQAEGSLLGRGGTVIGSELIGLRTGSAPAHAKPATVSV
jgi:K+-transporting ATPase ATPase C chain